MSNSKGSYSTTPERTMEAFDKLPPSAREALRHSAFCWAVQPILTRWKRGTKGYKNGKEIAARVESWDRDMHEKDVKRGRVLAVGRRASFKLGRA